MISVICIGKLKKGAFQELAAFYAKRLQGAVHIIELECKKAVSGETLQREEANLLQKAIPKEAFSIVLDERGKNIDSVAFAEVVQQQKEAARPLAIIIGGAEGLHHSITAQADIMLSFGKLTWPHQLVRIMILEQLYRAHTINTGHPYHK